MERHQKPGKTVRSRHGGHCEWMRIDRDRKQRDGAVRKPVT